VDKTIIIKSSPQAFELFGVKNVPKDLVNGKRPETVTSKEAEDPGKKFRHTQGNRIGRIFVYRTRAPRQYTHLPYAHFLMIIIC
jgi:hypothetical protein